MLTLPFLIGAVVLAFLGACVGSFLNVVIYRTTKGEQWVKGRSYCEQCKKQIAWFDNIPLLSYLLLKGRCRNCKTGLSLSHPVVEGLTAALFVWWYGAIFLFFKLTSHPFVVLQPLFWLAVGLILLIIFIVDFKYFIIPNLAVASLFGLTLLYRVLLTLVGIMQAQDLFLALLTMAGAGTFFFFIWLLTKGKGMGFGDVKLAFPLGLLLGWPATLVWIFSSFVIGALVGVSLILLGKAKMKNAIPFGPFLIVGTLIALVWGQEIFNWYLGFI